ncbi:MAG: hypothetical protein DRI57_27835 [Deltaproteobacteria bacterium]|nr:MAG: hypothetical protein DRI57_27835 [Deltaproteobacteria bacterium]
MVHYPYFSACDVPREPQAALFSNAIKDCPLKGTEQAGSGYMKVSGRTSLFFVTSHDRYFKIVNNSKCFQS